MLGVGLGCVDFAEDAFADQDGGGSRGNAVMVTFGPCLGFALYFPGAFLPALEFSGVFRQILFGAVPVLMVWRARQAAPADGHNWKDQPALARAKSWKHDVESLPAAGELLTSKDVLPFGVVGLGFVAAMTALMLMLELSHMLSV